MNLNFLSQITDEPFVDLRCTTCGHTERIEREQFLVRVATTLLREPCPKCGTFYTAEMPLSPAEELMPFGATVAEVMAHRGQASDVDLDGNIGFILQQKEERFGLRRFSRVEREVYAVQVLVREVDSGGFEQFFRHDSGALAFDVTGALEAIGALQTLAVAQEAMQRFGKPRSLSEKARLAQLEKLTEAGHLQPWEDLDARFYALDEDLLGLTLAHAARHLDQFGV